MKLITEINDDIDVIIEKAEGKPTGYYIEGVFLQSDLKNRNGRIYPFETLQTEVAKYDKNMIQQNRAFGELGHPEGPQINLERVSHMIKSLKVEGKNFIGRAKVMSETPYGKIVKNLIDEGAKLGVSSRGMGSIKQNTKNEAIVGGDFHLATAADIVADPSAPDAFVQGVMEGREWIYESGVFKQIDLEQYKEDVDNSNRKNREETKIKGFVDLFNKLSR
jgi:hypothetical protein